MSSPSPGPVNPWRRMWTAPAATLLNLLHFGQGDAWARPLLLGAGLLSSLAPQVRSALAEMLPQGTNVLGVALVSGLLLGGLQAFVWPALLQLACRWLGGQGTPRGTLLAAAWSSLPVLLSYVLAPLGGSGDVADAGAALYGIVSLLLSAWTLALLVQSLGAAQRLTPFKAGLGVVLGGILLFVTLLAAGFLAALVLVTLGLTPQLP